MNKNAQVALTVFNTAGLLALACALALRGDGAAARSAASTHAPDSSRLAELERRLARLEATTDLPGARPPTVREGDQPSGGAEASEESTTGPIGAATTANGSTDLDQPVTRREVEALIAERLSRTDRPDQAAAPAPAPARPRRPLREVARELGLDARQESTVRELYRQLERDSMKVLFEVDDAGLEQLKADLARAEHDPRLKEQLRERVAVNWARRSGEVGVLWVKLDARLREVLGLELLPRFYGFDVQQDEREFPDIGQMFFSPPAQDGR